MKSLPPYIQQQQQKLTQFYTYANLKLWWHLKMNIAVIKKNSYELCTVEPTSNMNNDKKLSLGKLPFT